jgi:protein translocase SecG subunit
MTTLLLIILLLSGALMSFAILLMAPKGGLGFGLGGGFAGSNEYGTKKSIEGGLKKLATVSAVIFIICSLVYPFTKPSTYDPSAAANSGAVAPNFDLGDGQATDQGIVPIEGDAPVDIVLPVTQ